MANIVTNDLNKIVHRLAPLQGLSNDTITVSGVTTLTVPDGARGALITVETADIRYWEDGSDPTSSDGLLRSAGSAFEILSAYGLTHFKCIEVSGSPVIQVQFYK